MDLTWTGNQFLEVRPHSDRFVGVVESMDITNKDDVWSTKVATAIATRFGFDPAYVRVSAGATQMIEVLLRTLRRGMVVDVTPNFHLTATICVQEDWPYVAVPVREPGTLIGRLGSHLDDPDAIISLSSPRNPLGYQFPVDDIATLLRRTAGTVILDEVYADFATDSAFRLIRDHPRLFVVRTFSKAWGLANLRIGYAVSSAFADPDLHLRALPNSVAGVAQRMARHMLAEPEPVEASVIAARAERDRMAAALSEIPTLRVWPSDANYLMVESPRAAEIVAELGRAGYEVRMVNELRGYPADWPLGVRIVVPPRPHSDAVVECVRRCVGVPTSVGTPR
jgi:histidinol-phosphate aminotransferase